MRNAEQSQICKVVIHPSALLFRIDYYDVYLLAIEYLDMKESIPCTVISGKAPALRNAFTKADWLLLDNTYSDSYVYSDWNKWYIGSSHYNGTGMYLHQ